MRTMNIDEKLAAVANTAYYDSEYEQELHPSEAREELAIDAQFHIDEWLNTGDTEPLTWLLASAV